MRRVSASTHHTPSTCPNSVWKHLPVRTSQNLSVLSSEPDTRTGRLDLLPHVLSADVEVGIDGEDIGSASSGTPSKIPSSTSCSVAYGGSGGTRFAAQSRSCIRNSRAGIRRALTDPGMCALRPVSVLDNSPLSGDDVDDAIDIDKPSSSAASPSVSPDTFMDPRASLRTVDWSIMTSFSDWTCPTWPWKTMRHSRCRRSHSRIVKSSDAENKNMLSLEFDELEPDHSCKAFTQSLCPFKGKHSPVWQFHTRILLSALPLARIRSLKVRLTMPSV